MNSKRHPTRNEVGTLGENAVAQWLTQQGARVLQQRWRCRWGEIDAIACFPATNRQPPTLAFVEVKTRRPHNWDNDGRAALSATKGDRLWKTAQMFLSQHPQYADWVCRFDLALVRYRPRPNLAAPTSPRDRKLPESIQLGQPFTMETIEMTLHAYLPDVLQ